MIFKKRHILRNSLMKTSPIRAPQEKVICVYSIFCECDRSCVREAGSSWAVNQRGHRQNLEERRLERSRLAHGSFEENHRIVQKKAKLLELEKNSVYREFKEAVYMSCLQNTNTRPSTEISPISYLLISKELSK